MNFKLFLLFFQIVHFSFTASITSPHYGNSEQLPFNFAGLPIGMPFSAAFPHLHPHSLLEQANYPLTLSGRFPHETAVFGHHLMNHPISGSLRSPQADLLVLASMISSAVGQNTLRQLLDSLSTARSSPAYGLSSHSPLSHPSGSLGPFGPSFGQSTQLLPYLLSPSYSSGLSLKKPSQVHHHSLQAPSGPEETSIYFDTPSPPLNVVFRSSSTAVNVQQVHSQTRGSLRQTSSVDSPQKHVHTVTKPIIHELNEIIAPVRKVTQKVLPVREEITTKVSKNHPEEIANKQEPLSSTSSQADSPFSKESSSQASLPIFSASSSSENSIELEKDEIYGERLGNELPPSDEVLSFDGVIGVNDARSSESNSPRKRRHRNGGDPWVDRPELVPFRPEDAIGPAFNQQQMVNQNWK